MAREGPGKLKWDSQPDLQEAVDSYFAMFVGQEADNHPKHNLIPNLFGLCRHLHISYDAMVDYESGMHDEKDERYRQLSVPIRNARLLCIEYANERALTHSKGATFLMSNLTRKLKEPYKVTEGREHTGEDGKPIQLKMQIEFVKSELKAPDA